MHYATAWFIPRSLRIIRWFKPKIGFSITFFFFFFFFFYLFLDICHYGLDDCIILILTKPRCSLVRARFSVLYQKWKHCWHQRKTHTAMILLYIDILLLFNNFIIFFILFISKPIHEVCKQQATLSRVFKNKIIFFITIYLVFCVLLFFP